MHRLEIDFKPLKDHLLVLVTGEYDVKEAIDGLSLALAACKLTGLSKIVFDFRPLDGVPQATEKVIYALGADRLYEDYLQAGGRILKIACLWTAAAVNSFEPGYDIALKWNLPLKLFTCEKDAYRWLQLVPPGYAIGHDPAGDTSP